MTRTYSAEERAEAVALAASVGPVKAAEALGIPRRTVSYWCHKPAAGPIIAAAEAGIAARLTEAHAQALAAVRASLSDPKARLGDKAQALRVLGEQAALAEGRATANVNVNANVNVSAITPEERSEARRYVAELRAKLDDGRLDEVEQAVAAQLQAEAHIEALMAALNIGADEARDRLVSASEVVNILRGSSDVG